MKYDMAGSESLTPESVFLSCDLPFMPQPSVWATLQKAIADFFYTLPTGNERKVWQYRDRRGAIWWCLYCPHTRTVQHFPNEEDVLLAIEKPGHH
jgi:hypothetical protein